MTNKNLVLSPNSEYELLDSGKGQKLERFGKYTLIRRESQAIWKPQKPELWNASDCEYIRTNEKFGDWKINNPDLPKEWEFKQGSITMKLKLTPFGHVGVFPELQEQWNWMRDLIEKQNTSPKVLSLFSYTGAATLAAAAAGASVTHVDASKPAITWAVENQKLSGLTDSPIRWIADDALKFVKREERRGIKYDGIIMDPPKFGRGPKGEVWQFEDDIPELLESCKPILSDSPLFFLLTAYTVPISPISLGNITSQILPESGIEYGELSIEDSQGKLLPTSIFSRWSKI